MSANVTETSKVSAHKRFTALAPELFELNRQIRAEAIDILYGSNTFEFVVEINLPHICSIYCRKFKDRRFPPARQGLSQAFGIHVRKLRIVVVEGCWMDERLFKAGKKFVRLIVDALTSTVTEGAALPTLEQLHIIFNDRSTGWVWDRRPPQRCTPFLLEPLALISKARRINDVKVENMPSYGDGFVEFGQKLERVLRGDVQLQEKQYESVKIMRRSHPGGSRKVVLGTRSKKCYYNADYDWDEVRIEDVLHEHGEQ
jgi:hypothetical protein